ncbi:MAG: transposase [Gemmatimonadetes bacterium]|nr:transposase [Gemmatimonadota bacterium]
MARVASHIPNKGQVLHRYYGWYASRTRGRANSYWDLGIYGRGPQKLELLATAAARFTTSRPTSFCHHG